MIREYPPWLRNPPYHETILPFLKNKQFPAIFLSHQGSCWNHVHLAVSAQDLQKASRQCCSDLLSSCGGFLSHWVNPKSSILVGFSTINHLYTTYFGIPLTMETSIWSKILGVESALLVEMFEAGATECWDSTEACGGVNSLASRFLSVTLSRNSSETRDCSFCFFLFSISQFFEAGKFPVCPCRFIRYWLQNSQAKELADAVGFLRCYRILIQNQYGVYPILRQIHIWEFLGTAIFYHGSWWGVFTEGDGII